MGNKSSKRVKRVPVSLPKINLVQISHNDCLFEFLYERDSINKHNPRTELLINGFVRNVLSNHSIVPSEITGLVSEFGHVVVLKYEINIMGGYENNIATEYTENIKDEHIAFFNLKFGSLRIKPILNDGTNIAYSKWVSTRGFHIRRRTITEWEVAQFSYKFDIFCDTFVDTDLFDLQQWLSLWNSTNVKLDVHDLKRVYYYLCCFEWKIEKTTTKKPTRRAISFFAGYDDILFGCGEWGRFRERLRDVVDNLVPDKPMQNSHLEHVSAWD